jgi:hypothetical protein
VLDDLVLGELQSAGFDAMGRDDINAILGLDRMRSATGCDEVSCMTELGGALGVDYLVAGNAALLDGMPVITLKLLHVAKARAISRANSTGNEGLREFPRLIGQAVQKLVAGSGL